MDDEIVKFLGKPDEQGELRDMGFAWEIDYHVQSKWINVIYYIYLISYIYVILGRYIKCEKIIYYILHYYIIYSK